MDNLASIHLLVAVDGGNDILALMIRLRQVLRPLMMALPMLLLVACENKPMVIVGTSAFPMSDIDKRARLIDAVHPGKGTRVVAAAQLLDGFIAHELLKTDFSLEIGEDALLMERQRATRERFPPPMMAHLDAIFGSDTKSALRVGILPDLAIQRLKHEFRNSGLSHQDANAKIGVFIQRTSPTPEAFQATAMAEGLKYSRLWVHPAKGVHELAPGEDYPSSMTEVDANSRQYAELLISFLQEMRLGEVRHDGAPMSDGTLAMRWVSATPSRALIIETAFAPAITFEQWRWKATSSMVAVIPDAKLVEQLKAKIPWAAAINITSGDAS